ncbi:hypothetical protein BH24ACT26_BH24ACT26_23110 [soil metagenome]
MIGLVGVEVRRLLARRVVRVVGLLVVLGIGLGATLTFINSDAITPAREATIERATRREVKRCVGHFPSEEDRSVAREECERNVFVPVEDPRLFLTELKGVAIGTTVPLVILSWLIGATAIGAEWHAGTMTTLLTWEPRRVRVLTAKLTAAALLAFVAAVVTQLLVGGALLPSALLHGSTEGADGAWLRSTAAIVARGAAMSSFATVIGFSIASVARNTAAALGAGFVYSAVIDPLVGAFRPQWHRWLLVENVALFITGQELAFPMLGRDTMDASVVLLIYIAVTGGIALLLFRQRDVT